MFLTGCVLCVVILCCVALCRVWALHPIVIVPGIGGSQLEAKLDRNKTSHWYCYGSSSDEWYTMWLSIEELMPFAEQCWVDNMKLVWDEASGRMQNTEGVEVRTTGFGTTSGIEWLDPYIHSAGVYFYPFVHSLVDLLGYTRGTDLRAAPYDFRKDPSYAGEYFKGLKALIENTTHTNEGKPVMLISHSMGCPYTVNFLRLQTEEWKKRYIAAWTAISGVYGGSMKAAMAYVSGDGFGIPAILDKPQVLRQFQRTFPSLAFILPDPRWWNKTETIVTTSKRTYTAHEYDDLFRDMGYPVASKIKQTVPSMWYPEPPGVRMFCFYGTQMPTPEHLYYPDGYFPDYNPQIDFGDGDGTVNYRSLELCKTWIGKQTAPIIVQEFTKAEHNGILSDARLFEALIAALKQIDEEYQLTKSEQSDWMREHSRDFRRRREVN